MIIAFLGLPGVGKTTLASALAELLAAQALLEPEESEWPDYVRQPHPNGDFTRLSWFRTQRVPLYYRADALRRAGETAILDSYYDKWCAGWLGQPGLEWLISPKDPYMAPALHIAELDARLLPPADVVVLLEIDHDLWMQQLAARSRIIDRNDEFLCSYSSQEHFVRTALDRSAQDGTTLIRHRREPRAPEAEADAIASQLREHDQR